MKHLKSIGSLLVVALTICACQKEEEESQVFVQKHILGAWPISYQVKTTFTDDVETKKDTLTYKPVDTLVFTAEGQAIRRNKTIISSVGYTVAPDGESISFSTTPVSTLQLTFVQNTRIGLGTETASQQGGKKITIQLVDHLIRK